MNTPVYTIIIDHIRNNTYSETCLIWPAVGEKFWVEIDRVLDYTVQKHRKRSLSELTECQISKTCLIWHALGEKFSFRIDRRSDYTLPKKWGKKASNGNENFKRWITQWNGLHRCQIKQGLLYKLILVTTIYKFIHCICK